ncbi:winged helix-turn-helix domain-containing protein [Microbulbifer sp. MLAF003]|uniref:winged helix-turn-helix domain-containing protein n=1 Tax=Microbulbifer sp. MLAF003 TaxID=3032582 RepID=UPI0024AE07DA|nr:winged helix-turn-helix domain-containing protein [Microbulbifer sp. MLAF003]WHI49746.1 winged helix-turn-helix domain-containing protein [Microbulbifer sp. MLAF003]
MASKKRGYPEGTNRRLTVEKKASKQISDEQPDQLKLDYILWARKAVMELIEPECGLKMPIRTVGDYLKRRGFTP